MADIDYFKQLNQVLKDNCNVVELERNNKISKWADDKRKPHLSYDLSIVIAPKEGVYKITQKSCRYLDSLLYEITSFLKPLDELQIFDEHGYFKNQYNAEKGIDSIIGNSCGFIRYREAKVYRGAEDSTIIYAPHKINHEGYDDERHLFVPPVLYIEKKIGRIAGIRKKIISEQFMFSPDYNVSYELYKMGFGRSADIQSWENSKKESRTVSNDATREIRVTIIPNTDCYRIVSNIRQVKEKIEQAKKNHLSVGEYYSSETGKKLKEALESHYGSVGQFINWEFFVKKFNKSFRKLHKD